MVGRGAQGNPWALREIVDGDVAEPTREEVAAELVLFVRETVRELGERRASGFLKKFYGWYLGQRPLPEAVQAGAAPARLDRGGRAASVRSRAGRDRLVERLEAEIPTGDEVTLELPDLRLRRRVRLSRSAGAG